MNEPRTALDLTALLAAEVIGNDHWKLSLGLAGVLAPNKINPIRNKLATIPADAVEQIARLQKEIEQLSIRCNIARIDWNPPPLRRP